MKTLTQLSQEFDTDKRPENHNYMPMYEFWLKDRNISKFLEIGFGPGGSMKMWTAYYPDAEVYCMDTMGKEYQEVWKSPDTNIPGLRLIEGDSTNPEAWLQIPYGLDVIIDDGDHTPTSQIATFMIGFGKLKSNGLYFIEDLHCNFEPIYTDHDVIFPWLQQLILGQQAYRGTEGDFYKFRGLMPWPSRDVLSYHIYKSVVLFIKA